MFSLTETIQLIFFFCTIRYVRSVTAIYSDTFLRNNIYIQRLISRFLCQRHSTSVSLCSLSHTHTHPMSYLHILVHFISIKSTHLMCFYKHALLIAHSLAYIYVVTHAISVFLRSRHLYHFILRPTLSKKSNSSPYRCSHPPS